MSTDLRARRQSCLRLTPERVNVVRSRFDFGELVAGVPRGVGKNPPRCGISARQKHLYVVAGAGRVRSNQLTLQQCLGLFDRLFTNNVHDRPRSFQTHKPYHRRQRHSIGLFMQCRGNRARSAGTIPPLRQRPVATTSAVAHTSGGAGRGEWTSTGAEMNSTDGASPLSQARQSRDRTPPPRGTKLAQVLRKPD